MTTRAVIYARYSSDTQSENSIDDQVRICRARAEREGWTVVEVYADYALSGATTNRPRLRALIADARPNRPRFWETRRSGNVLTYHTRCSAASAAAR
jgi:DNA invertase Pin-like site-specific DNA recombinase